MLLLTTLASLLVTECRSWHSIEETVHGEMMTKAKLQVRKQQLVKDAIYDAAIELFAAKGFDETTVEEIALTAGVSRRSFFRYYATKDDLLAQSVINYGVALTDGLATCPATLSQLEILRETVFMGVEYVAGQPLTRQIIEISLRSTSARRAHASRLMDVEDSLAVAYAKRLKNASGNELKPRLMAHLTITVMNVATAAWFTREYKDLSTSAKQVFSNLTHLLCDPGSALQSKGETRQSLKSSSPSPLRKSIK